MSIIQKTAKILLGMIIFPCLLAIPGHMPVATLAHTTSSYRNHMEDLLLSNAVWNSKISPDGQWIVYRVQQRIDPYDHPVLYQVPMDRSSGPSAVWIFGCCDGDSFSITYQISPDSNYVVFYEGNGTYQLSQLFSKPLHGGGQVQLSNKLNGGTEITAYQISPDGNWVIYKTETKISEFIYNIRLWSVPIDRSHAPVLLYSTTYDLWPIIPNFLLTFQISPDSSRVVYNLNLDRVDAQELYSAPIDGSTAPIKLNDDLLANRNVANDFLISADSNWVVYRVDQVTDDVYELYSVPLDRSTAPIRLSSNLVAGGNVVKQQISPDSNRVVYSADQDINEVFELYSVPIDGSAMPVKLNGALDADSDVNGWQISPDSNWVVYQADQDTPGVLELYTVPIDASIGPVKLNNDLNPGESVASYQISADSNWVVYRADQEMQGVLEIYSAPIDASATSIRLNTSLVQGGNVVGFQISMDSNRVVYRADQEQDNAYRLYSTPIDGSAAPVRLLDYPAIVGNVASDYWITPDSHWVGYRANQQGGGAYGLYIVPTDGWHNTFLPATLSGSMFP